MSAFDSSLSAGEHIFPEASALPLTTLTASSEATQKGINAHVTRLLDECGGTRLISLAPEVFDKLCIDCNVVVDSNSGANARKCESCLCSLCGEKTCPKTAYLTSQGREEAQPQRWDTIVGCLRCALKGAVRSIPKGKDVPFLQKRQVLEASTESARFHVGCMLARCVRDSVVVDTIRCPTCRELVFPPAANALLPNQESSMQKDQTANIIPPHLLSDLGRKGTVDMFSLLNKMDPRLACFNDIHAGVRGWGRELSTAETGIELKRRPRTLEVYFHVTNPKSLPPLRASNPNLLEEEKARDALLESLGQREADKRRKRVRVEETAQGILISNAFPTLRSSDAHAYASVLGASIVESLAGGTLLRQVPSPTDEQGGKRKASAKPHNHGRVSTGTLGESPFVLARAKRLGEMQQLWDAVGAGVFDESM